MVDRKYHLRENIEELEKTCKKSYIRIGEIGAGRQGERIYSINGCAMTLSSTSGGLGGKTGMYLVGNSIRKLSPRECARLMGFPDSFIPASTIHMAHKQFGNSVVVDVIQRIILEAIKANQGGNNQ
jgi:DNA (cytosine-5)-methyltransferase 1